MLEELKRGYESLGKRILGRASQGAEKAGLKSEFTRAAIQNMEESEREIGPTASRVQDIAAVAAAAPVAAVAARPIATAIAKAPKQSLFRAGAAWGAGAAIKDARTGDAAINVMQGDATPDDIKRYYESLKEQSQPQGVTQDYLSTAYEIPLSAESGRFAQIGNVTDLAGAASGIAQTMAAQKLSGQNPMEAKTLAKNVGRHALETGVGIASRYIEPIGKMARRIPGVGGVFAGAANRFGTFLGWSGGAAQKRMGGPSNEERDSARKALEEKYRYLTYPKE